MYCGCAAYLQLGAELRGNVYLGHDAGPRMEMVDVVCGRVGEWYVRVCMGRRGNRESTPDPLLPLGVGRWTGQVDKREGGRG